MKGVTYILFLLVSQMARSWAGDSLLAQISSGSSECKRDELFGSFDLNAVPQFSALCNIPVPGFQQSQFLLDYNVVPILCMGLMDVSLRLCKSVNDDVTPFRDIFPPSTTKFSKIFLGLSKSKDFSEIDEFCSMTVKKFAIKEASSNVTEPWWQLLNTQLGDEKHCSAICHSNEENKVHPLCSFILWTNGIFINFKKNKGYEQFVTSGGEDQQIPVVQKVEEPTDQNVKSNQDSNVEKNESSNQLKEAVIGPDIVPIDKKPQSAAADTPNLTTDNNNVGVGTVEQVVNNVDQPVVIGMLKTDNNTSPVAEVAKKVKIRKSKKHKVMETVSTSIPVKSSNTSGSNAVEEKPLISSDLKPNAATMASKVPEPENAEVGAPEFPKAAKDEAKPDGESVKAGEGLVEGDVSVEVTPEGVGLDQPFTGDKDIQGYPPPGYSDEDTDNGDGDDIDMGETTGDVNNNDPVSNSNKTAAGIQQAALEGDKVYGEGEILIEDHFIEAEDSHFFTYFLCMAVLTIMAYLAFHNKKKLIALAVEGRRTKGGRRRPNSSHYSKLDCSLEEALVSNSTASVTHVLY